MISWTRLAISHGHALLYHAHENGTEASVKGHGLLFCGRRLLGACVDAVWVLTVGVDAFGRPPSWRAMA